MGAPYERRVWEVIHEELSQQRIEFHELPEREQEALRNIVRRLAGDLEFTTRSNAEFAGM